MGKAILALCAVALVASCGPAAKPKAKKVVIKVVPGEIGAACKPKAEDFDQGSCAAGLMCAGRAPGGYCTSLCPCGKGATCVESTKAPEMCAKTCKDDVECRAKAGYSCDPGLHVCTVVGMLAPKAPMCEPPAPTLPRKTFGKAIQLTTGNSGATTVEPAAILDKNGDLVTVYVAGLATGPNPLGSAKLNLKDAVDGDHLLKLDRDNHFDPWLAADRKGKLYLSFLGFDGGKAPEKHMLVGLATSDDGLNWGKTLVAHDISTDCPGDAPGCMDKPIIAIGPEKSGSKTDVVYVFYYSAVSRGLRATHSMDGGESFSPSAAVGDGAFADVDVTSSGKVHVAYASAPDGANPMGDTQNGIYYVKSADAANSFSKPVRVSAQSESIPFLFSSPQIIADADPNRAMLYVVYPSGTPDGKWDIMLATSKDGGTTWSRATVNDDGPCASHMTPAAALDPVSGRLHITWLENRSGVGSLVYASCAPGGMKCSANELVSETPFAAYGFGRHSTKWVGDYNSLVLDAKRKLLRAVWTQPVDEAGQVAGRIFTATAKLK